MPYMPQIERRTTEAVRSESLFYLKSYQYYDEYLDADEVEATLPGDGASQQGLAGAWSAVQQQTRTQAQRAR